MKRHLTKFLGILAALTLIFAMLNMTAFALSEGDYEYTVSENKATITAYGGAGGNVLE